jgi:hypothetical protein
VVLYGCETWYLTLREEVTHCYCYIGFGADSIENMSIA